MKVLVVEDHSENIAAAREFFDGQGIEINVATSVEHGIQMLQETVYYAAILDVELPMREGDEPERLGPEVGKVAKEMAVPYVYLTGGYEHGGPMAKVFLDEVCLESNLGDMVPSKTNARAWVEAWKALQSFGNLEEIYQSRVRYRQRTGKMYRR